MKIVIDIPIEWLFDMNNKKFCQTDSLYQKILNGIPLPKGHGRLGDLDKIWCKLKELEEYYQAEFFKESDVLHESAMNGRLYGFTNAKFIVQDAPTIIEADTESEVKGYNE